MSIPSNTLSQNASHRKMCCKDKQIPALLMSLKESWQCCIIRREFFLVFLLCDKALRDRLGRKDTMSQWLRTSETNLRRLFVRNAFMPDGSTNKIVFFLPKTDGQKHFEEESRHISAMLLICLSPLSASSSHSRSGLMV